MTLSNSWIFTFGHSVGYHYVLKLDYCPELIGHMSLMRQRLFITHRSINTNYNTNIVTEIIVGMTSAYNYNTQINQSNKLLQKYLDKNLLGMTSACLNPVLYGFLNESYKKEFKVDFHLNSNFLHTCWEHIVKIIQFGSILFFSVYPPITYFFICFFV